MTKKREIGIGLAIAAAYRHFLDVAPLHLETQRRWAAARAGNR